MAKTIFTLLYLIVTIIQASPIPPDITQLSNTTQVKTETSLFKREWPPFLFEPENYWEEQVIERWWQTIDEIDRQPAGCRQSTAIDGYWISSCCYRGSAPVAAFDKHQWATARTLKRIAKYYLANPNFYRKDLGPRGVCTPWDDKHDKIERACISWSDKPEFEISDMLQWYIISVGMRCSNIGRWAQLHIIPEEGEHRLNVCVSDHPECHSPHQDRVPGCGSNDEDGNKLPCPDLPPKPKKKLHQEKWEPWLHKTHITPINTTLGAGINDMQGNRHSFPKDPDSQHENVTVVGESYNKTQELHD